jgi:hypothetical protein
MIFHKPESHVVDGFQTGFMTAGISNPTPRLWQAQIFISRPSSPSQTCARRSSTPAIPMQRIKNINPPAPLLAPAAAKRLKFFTPTVQASGTGPTEMILLNGVIWLSKPPELRNLRAGAKKSGGGPPRSKTLAREPETSESAKRLGAPVPWRFGAGADGGSASFSPLQCPMSAGGKIPAARGSPFPGGKGRDEGGHEPKLSPAPAPDGHGKQTPNETCC